MAAPNTSTELKKVADENIRQYQSLFKTRLDETPSEDLQEVYRVMLEHAGRIIAIGQKLETYIQIRNLKTILTGG